MIKLSPKSILIIPVIITLMTLVVIILCKSPYNQEYIYEDKINQAEDEEPLIEYFLDSTYKVVADTLINIYITKTGEKISTLSMFYEPIHSMAMHPSGQYLAVLGESFLEVYDLKKDNLANTYTTMPSSDDDTWLDVMEEDYIEFSADGKYLMVIDYSDAEVMIYKWPGLKYLDSGYMGFLRNNFWWENIAGKLVFHFRESIYTYRTEFPSDPLSGSLTFSEPVLIDSVPDNE
jgi:hypothetical protein